MSPPKIKFTKEKIFDAAFNILREKGWAYISARTIAKELNASTMPIYSTVESMEEVGKELKIRALKIMHEYQLEKYTENPFLNSAIGYIIFARDLPYLFRFLYFERPEKISARELHKLKQRLPKELRQLAVDYFREISPKKLNNVALQSWVFTHGLAVLLYSNVLTHLKNKDITIMLENAGDAFFKWERSKQKKNQKT